jgi:hypothetical protein
MYVTTICCLSSLHAPSSPPASEREARKKERMEKEMKELRLSLEARQSEIKAKQQQVGERRGGRGRRRGMGETQLGQQLWRQLILLSLTV